MEPDKPDGLPTPVELKRAPIDPTWEEPLPEPALQPDGSSRYLTADGTVLAVSLSLLPAFLSAAIGADVLCALPHYDAGQIAFLVFLAVAGAWVSWSLLHAGIRRIDIDDTRITFECLLGTRRSLLLAKLQGDVIWHGKGNRAMLRVTTVDGRVVMVPEVYFSPAAQAAIREDLARRCLKVTGRHIDGTQPLFTLLELNQRAWAYILLPFAVIIAIPLVAWLKHHGYIH